MPKSMKVAFTCYATAVALLSAFGLTYLFRPEFMPYHADAVAREWASVEGSFQVLILALMRVAGGGWLAAAIAIAVLLLVPFRQGYRWALWCIPAVGLVVSLPTLYATFYVRHYTPGKPPWAAALAGIALLLMGFASSLLAVRDETAPRERRY
jgi:hypothetical protein